MLIHEIVEFCDNEYRSHRCHNCTHPTICLGSCKSCLEQIHYPARYPYGKKDYDCENLINFYVCDYTNKYASEILYLLRKSEKMGDIHEYHILSIGCGATPDLMAFEQYVYETNPYKQVLYFGIDKNLLWEQTHQEIMRYKSDIKNDINNRSHNEPLIILINDVNSCNRGRDFFEDLIRILKENKFKGRFCQFYFDYKIQNDFQKYGRKHSQNNTLFDLDGIDLDIYEPWKECSSAQMLIEIY